MTNNYKTTVRFLLFGDCCLTQLPIDGVAFKFNKSHFFWLREQFENNFDPLGQ